MKALRYIGRHGCRDQRYASALAESSDNLVILDLTSKRPNIAFRATIDGQRLYLRTSSTVRDFRDIAVMSYILDTLARRKDGADHWSREFNCSFPVRDARLWKANEHSLRQLIATLAGDEYHFDWLSASNIPSDPKHRARIPKMFDAVCLFSGGTDSLLGAHKLLQQGKRLLLVGHQSEPATAAAQKEIFKHLARLFPKRASLVQFRVAVSRNEQPLFPIPEGEEDTHRVRSFLFLGLAVAVANMAGSPEIYMPENGLIAINPPLDLSRLGTCSTRTAHPRFLRQFLQLSRAVGAYSGTLKNPFLYESKTDMLRTFEPKLKAALLRTVSCSRPSRYQERRVRHCGYCVPCIYRRVAFAASGLDAASDYAFDVFKQLVDMTVTARRDFAALVEFARRYRLLSPLRKQGTVVSQGYFSPAVGEEIGPYATSDYSPWVQMLDRWTGEFLTLFDERATAATKKSLRWPQSGGKQES
jgi:7-cyano-7-deazaguanine synthase in queuosine biosynthesis